MAHSIDCPHSTNATRMLWTDISLYKKYTPFTQCQHILLCEDMSCSAYWEYSNISLYFVSSKQLQELTFGNTHVVNSVFCSSKVTQRVHVLKYFCWNISIQDKIAKIYEPDLCMSIWYIAHVRLYGFRCMFALLRSWQSCYTDTYLLRFQEHPGSLLIILFDSFCISWQSCNDSTSKVSHIQFKEFMAIRPEKPHFLDRLVAIIANWWYYALC